MPSFRSLILRPALLLTVSSIFVFSSLIGCASSAPPNTSSQPAPSLENATSEAVWASSELSDSKEAYARRQFIKGLTRAQIGDSASAIDHYEKALQAAPETPTLLSALAEVQATQNDLSTAIYHAQEARRLAPEEVHYHHQLARLYQRAGQVRRAIQTYQHLLERFPSAREARLSLARLYAEQGEARKALATYEVLAEPTSPLLLEEMLSLYRTVDDPEGIEHTLKTLIQQAPEGNDEYRRTLAQFYQSRGRPQAAVPLLENLLEQNPDDAKAAALLANVYRATGRAEDAAALGNQSSASITATADQLVERARSHYRRAVKGAPDAEQTTVHLLEKALQKDSTHAEALALLGELRFETGAFPQAAELLKRALTQNPRAPERWARAAEAYLEAGQPERAAAVADEGLLLFPGQVPLLHARATALMRMGQDAAAVRHLEEALHVMRIDGLLESTAHTIQAAQFHDTLARLYARQGKSDQATHHRKRARALRESLSTASN